MTRTPERIFLAITGIALLAAWYFYHSPLLMLFVLSWASDFHAAAMIQLKARRVLDSWEWQVMFVAIGVSLGLTTTALFLSLFPQYSGKTATIIWFSGFALKRVLFAVGFRQHVLNVVELFIPSDYAIEQQKQSAYATPEQGDRVSVGVADEKASQVINSAKLDTIKAMLSDVQQGTPPIPVKDEAVLEKLTVIADKTDKKLDTIQESADEAAQRAAKEKTKQDEK